METVCWRKKGEWEGFSAAGLKNQQRQQQRFPVSLSVLPRHRRPSSMEHTQTDTYTQRQIGRRVVPSSLPRFAVVDCWERQGSGLFTVDKHTRVVEGGQVSKRAASESLTRRNYVRV